MQVEHSFTMNIKLINKDIYIENNDVKYQLLDRIIVNPISEILSIIRTLTKKLK